MARCWVLRKRAGLVLLLMVVCAVRMLAVDGGVGCSLFLGLLLCSWFWVRLVVLSPACGVRVVSGGLGLWVWWVARAVGHRTALLVAWVRSFGAWSLLPVG